MTKEQYQTLKAKNDGVGILHAYYVAEGGFVGDRTIFWLFLNNWLNSFGGHVDTLIAWVCAKVEAKQG